MPRRSITLTDVLAGNVPDDLEAVRWSDGTVECRFNLTATDYLERRRASRLPDDAVGGVITVPTECDRCADKCG